MLYVIREQFQTFTKRDSAITGRLKEFEYVIFISETHELFSKLLITQHSIKPR